MLTQLNQALPYTFRSLERLKEALTSPATDNRCNYQRLEFLGDAVLGLLIADALYKTHPSLNEGCLTAIRNTIVSGDAIYQRSTRIYPQWPTLLSSINVNYQGNQKAIVDVIEALIGAAWLEGGLEAAKQIVFTLIPQEEIAALKNTRDDSESLNPKGALQTFTQKRFQATPSYTCISKEGPAHQPTFTCAVNVLNYEALGTGRSLKEAESLAATKLLQQLRQQDLF
jgi:ribonuclease-3